LPGLRGYDVRPILWPNRNYNGALMINIGSHTLRNRVALAPMAGVTDVPFRQLAWRLGAPYMVGEMTGSRPELKNTRKTLLRREAVQGAVHAVQIAGTEPGWIADAVRDAIAGGAEIVDLNFGCPAKKVCRKAAGSALMAHPAQIVALTEAAVAAAQPAGVPVTVKTRTGPAPDQRNAPELARALEQTGISALAIHGRTRACKFVGKVEFDTVARVKSAVRIPVFANGDICNPQDARWVLAQTDADGVMIGRAALGAPWLPGWIVADLEGRRVDPPSASERLKWLREQLVATHRFYGSEQGVRIARKHVQWTLGHDTLDVSHALAGLLRNTSQRVLRAACANQQLDLLDSLTESDSVAARAA